MTNICSPLPYNFYSKKPLEVKFSGLDLSSDAGLLLIRQAEQGQQICQGIADCLSDISYLSKDSFKVRDKLPKR